MLGELDLLTVKQRLSYNVLKLIYKAEFDKLPEYLSEMLRYVADSQPYGLRNNGQFRLPLVRSTFGQNSLMYNGVKLYNQMKSAYPIDGNIMNFKSNLMEFVKNNNISRR